MQSRPSPTTPPAAHPPSNSAASTSAASASTASASTGSAPAVTVQALLLMLCAMTLVPAGDTAGKMLTGTLGAAPLFVAWSRFALGALLLLPFLRGSEISAEIFLDWRIWLRGSLIVAGVGSVLTALSTEPMANVFGAFFIGPILSYFLSALLLKERITLGQTLLLFLGFMGVLLVVRPGFGMTPGLGFACLGGVFYGFYLVASRWLANAARPRALLLSQLVAGSVILAPFGIATLPPVTAELAVLTLFSALGSALGNLCLVLAYRRAPASRLAPFVYAQLFAATLFGFLFFGDLPDMLTIAGLTVLIVAGGSAFLLGRR